jgi:hypothetical protein
LTSYPSMAYKATTIEELIAIMKRVQGEKTLTKFAAELDMSKQYLSNVYNRHKEPSERLLEKTGLHAANHLRPVADCCQPGEGKVSSNNSHSAPSSGKQRVLVNVILDKSGSMSTKVQDVIGGFNLYLDELAKEPAVDYGFSLTLFDSASFTRGINRSPHSGWASRRSSGRCRRTGLHQTRLLT